MIVDPDMQNSRSAKASALPYVAITVATALSFAVGGYIPIWNNNIYHLPILFGSYDLPQFQNEPFVQSLRNFSSGFWLLFAGTGRFVDPKIFFGFWLVVSHLLFLGSAVHLARSLGYRNPGFLSVFVIALALSALSVGSSGGDGGLIIEGFSHSELANASLLMALSFALTGRYGPSVFMVCVTFFLNAFMGVWAVPPILFVATYHVMSRQQSMLSLIRSALPGLAGLVLVIPVLWSILQNREGLVETDFSYREFLWGFYPDHFFITSLSPDTLLEMAALVAVLALTSGRHGQASPAFLGIALGALAVVALGVAAPLLTDSRTILNLHLIRSFVVLHMLANVSLLLFAMSRLWSARNEGDMALGLLLVGLLVLPRPLWMLALPLLLVERFGRIVFRRVNLPPDPLRIAASLFLAVCIAIVPLRVYRKLQYTSAMSRGTAEWEALGSWARLNTDPNSVFLIAAGKGAESSLGFSYAAERQIWTDGKFGAATMWSPSYFETWSTRQPAVDALTGIEAMRSYAMSQDIDYVAADCDPSVAAVHRLGGLCIYTGADAAR